jgi:multiple sugar transport system ATP-binding protein
VLRKGVVQQVDSPRNLYNSPANLFVAGFIGSPSMNLVPGQLTGTSLTVPFGSFPLPQDVAQRLGNTQAGERQVIVGIRPEHFEDASLVDDAVKGSGLLFRNRIENIEWLGAELYAYLPYQGGEAIGRQLDQLAGDLDMEQSTGDESQIVARLDATSRVREGEEAEIWLDARKLHLFDPETGEALARPPLA